MMFKAKMLCLLFALMSATLFSVENLVNGDTEADAGINVLGNSLETCSLDPMTGWYRNGQCNTDKNDHGTHVVCARMTDEFLQFTKSKGNDLVSPSPGNQFPGLKAGDKWCLCSLRWKEAIESGKAPKVILGATNKAALDAERGGLTLENLQKYATN